MSNDLIMEFSDVVASLEKFREGEKTILHENANKDSRQFSTAMNLTAGIVGKSEGIKMLPEHVALAHINGDIHFHDLAESPRLPITNCCIVDFKEMFKNGFTLGNAEIAPPKSIQTAAAQMAQVIASVSASQYGGTSIDRADELLAPYAEMNYQKHLNDLVHLARLWPVEKENQDVIDSLVEELAKEKTYKDIYDAMQSIEYEVNTLFTTNGQTPFITLGFGLGTNDFEREIQKAILEIRLKGLGTSNRTAIFPKLIYGIKDGVNFKESDPNYDIKQLALECSIKRVYPDILNYEMTEKITGSYKAPMGCRSFPHSWKNEKGEEVTSGRNNLGVVTMNLPRLAMKSQDKEEFFMELEKLALCAKDALVFRMNRTFEAIPENAPTLFKNGALGFRLNSSDLVKDIYLNDRATISLGYIGLSEVAHRFYGENWESNREAKEFTLGILQQLSYWTDAWSKETGVHFSVYATPAESLTDRFAKLDLEIFGENDITSKGYYINSFHYDPRKEIDPFSKIDFESEYPQYSPGGFIHYTEQPKMDNNKKGLEAIWDYSYDKVAYLGTNIPIDKCFECGSEEEFIPTAEGYACSACGNSNPETCDVVKRQCGYLGQPQLRPNISGRKKEIDSRIKNSI